MLYQAVWKGEVIALKRMNEHLHGLGTEELANIFNEFRSEVLLMRYTITII